MISSIAWVPAGVADPNPKKYEMSQTEKELIDMMENKGNLEELLQQEQRIVQQPSALPKISLPLIDASTLPADLRMDEYSSDDEDDNNNNDNIRHKDGVALGRLLVGNTDDFDEEGGDDDIDPQQENREQNKERRERNDEDSDSDDDLADVPDTREFEQIDMEGLQAMGLSNVGTNSASMLLEEDDDDEYSEAEDVRIAAGDAVLALAKTEDVSDCHAKESMQCTN